MTFPSFVSGLALGLAGLGCASSRSPAAASPDPPANPVNSVSAVVLANGCSHLGKENARLAETAMNQLVDGCSHYTGPSVRFTAQLLPDGSIRFEPREGQSDVVPICVLSHALRHRVRLATACALEVKLQQGTVGSP